MNSDCSKITIGHTDFVIRKPGLRQRDPGYPREYCAKRNGDRGEAYWILNPAPKNTTDRRLVVECTLDRSELAELADKVNKYCKNPEKVKAAPAIAGIEIK